MAQTIRYNTIRHTGPMAPRDRTAQVSNQAFAAGASLGQRMKYMRLQEMKIAEAKEQQRKSQLYQLVKDIPQGFDNGVIPSGANEIASQWLLGKNREYGALAAQIVDGKLDPTSEEFYSISSRMNSIKSAITNYEDQMKKKSKDITTVTDASNPKAEGVERLADIPDNDFAQEFFITANSNGYDQEIDDNGDVKYFKTEIHPVTGEEVRIPVMHRGKQVGTGNMPSYILKDKNYETLEGTLYDNDAKYLEQYEKYGKVTSKAESDWERGLTRGVKRLSFDQLRALVMDDSGQYHSLMTREMLNGFDDPETEENEGFYDKDGDGKWSEGDMSWNDLYNDHNALKDWYMQQKREVVQNTATEHINKWNNDNPVGTDLPDLKNPELAVINTIRSTENLYNKDLNPSIQGIEDLQAEIESKDPNYFNTIWGKDLIKKNTEKINLLRENIFKTTKDHLNRTLGYHKNAGGRMLYTVQEAYDFYNANADTVNKEWESNEAKFHNKNGEIDKDKLVEVDGVNMKHEAWLKTKPTFAENLEEWKSMELKRTNIPNHGIVFMNPSTNPLLPTTYTYESDLSTDPTDPNFINIISKYIADEGGEDYNLKTLQAHGYLGFDGKLF